MGEDRIGERGKGLQMLQNNMYILRIYLIKITLV